jgi:hypothetical protein
MSALEEPVKYRLLSMNWREAESLDWSATGWPGFALQAPDEEIKFWPVPADGIRIQKDDEGYFIDLREMHQ